MRTSTQIFVIAVAFTVFGIAIHSLVYYYNPFNIYNIYSNLYTFFCVLLFFIAKGLRIRENLKIIERQKREQLKQTIKEAIRETKED